MADVVRAALLLRCCFEVLRDADGPLPVGEVYDRIRERIELTSYEQTEDDQGRARWRIHLGYHTGDAATIGWLTKVGGWTLTEAGVEALDTYPGDQLFAEMDRRAVETRRQRQRATAVLSGSKTKIAEALKVVTESYWTSVADLAELADVDSDTVAHFLASSAVANAHRVLDENGRPLPPGMTHARYRNTDIRTRLESEGLRFEQGRAAPERRMTAAMFTEWLAELEPADALAESTGPRAWLVRGSSVDGRDLVPVWFQRGTTSLAAATLRPITVPIEREELRAIVEADYQYRPYSAREMRLNEFDAFCNKMRVGDYVLTTTQGKAYVGLITGNASYTKSADDRSNLRRPVEWLNETNGVPFSRLPQPLPARLHSQADVVEITDNVAAIESLLERLGINVTEPEPADVRRELSFPEVTPELAHELLIDQQWLQEQVDILWDRRQVIIYGPPGTGKTFVAKGIASFLAEPSAVKLVQFHPSYTYEDFFQGFRPEPREDGQLTFKLKPGPFRRLVESARENPTEPHILIIDEINRANLAKVFGELYFLLEYRYDAIELLYSEESEFTLPDNVFLIGTMNTTDRSIALLDAAMRRRFAFIELHPAEQPTSGLLAAWLKRQQDDAEAPAHHNLDAPDLLDALNERIGARDLAIGPSYLMRLSIYRDEDGLERVWRTSILPLLEEMHYGAGPDVLAPYQLGALRAALGGEQSTTDDVES